MLSNASTRACSRRDTLPPYCCIHIGYPRLMSVKPSQRIPSIPKKIFRNIAQVKIRGLRRLLESVEKGSIIQNWYTGCCSVKSVDSIYASSHRQRVSGAWRVPSVANPFENAPSLYHNYRGTRSQDNKPGSIQQGLPAPVWRLFILEGLPFPRPALPRFGGVQYY